MSNELKTNEHPEQGRFALGHGAGGHKVKDVNRSLYLVLDAIEELVEERSWEICI